MGGVEHGPLVRPCPSCGAMAWVKASQCARCGASLPATNDSAAVPAYPSPPERHVGSSEGSPLPAPSAPAPRPSRLRAGLGDLGSAAALAITLLIFSAATSVGLVLANWGGVGQVLGPSCSFGITGTAASITVHGWSSGDACKALRSGASFQTYDLPREASENPVICQYAVLNNRIVVHDVPTGTAGGRLCTALRNALRSPAPTASP